MSTKHHDLKISPKYYRDIDWCQEDDEGAIAEDFGIF